MIFQITLLKHGASSTPEQHLIEALSKDLALNSLVLDHGIDISKYQSIYVCDLSKHIKKSTIQENHLNVEFSNHNEDSVLSYDQAFFKSPSIDLMGCSYYIPSHFDLLSKFKFINIKDYFNG